MTVPRRDRWNQLETSEAKAEISITYRSCVMTVPRHGHSFGKDADVRRVDMRALLSRERWISDILT